MGASYTTDEHQLTAPACGSTCRGASIKPYISSISQGSWIRTYYNYKDNSFRKKNSSVEEVFVDLAMNQSKFQTKGPLEKII